MSGDADGLEPTLRNVIDQKTLKWVFVGGEKLLREFSGLLLMSPTFYFRKGRRWKDDVLLLASNPAR